MKKIKKLDIYFEKRRYPARKELEALYDKQCEMIGMINRMNGFPELGDLPEDLKDVKIENLKEYQEELKRIINDYDVSNKGHNHVYIPEWCSLENPGTWKCPECANKYKAGPYYLCAKCGHKDSKYYDFRWGNTKMKVEEGDEEVEIKYIEKEILKHFRIENFQMYLQKSGLDGYCKDLTDRVKKLLRFFMYYNILLDLKEEKEMLAKRHEQPTIVMEKPE